MASAEQQKTGLLDLSIELRNQIYGYVLQADKPIEIELIRRRDGPLELARRGIPRNMHHRHEVYDRRKKAWVLAEIKYAAIIYVGRQVYLEASAILYAVNCFKFANTTALRDILPILGKCAALLRYVEIEAEGCRSCSAPAAFKALSIATNLKKIHIGHFDVCDSHNHPYAVGPSSIASLVENCGPLLKCLQSSYREQKKGIDIAQVISMRVSTCRDCCHDPMAEAPGQGHRSAHGYRDENNTFCGWLCSGVKTRNEELENLISNEILRLLHKDEEAKFNDLTPKQIPRRSKRNKKE
ncbi:hypothetical protein CLAFUW4_09251 [Fulvia fulva]|nr:hypothetical protein CLAFUR4_09257 [Fulvia fulva]KAK4614419.1 hypothetical protein CLAFUR0_09249 [Fulvia fulva]WPV20469.1 hypothetical protein CLAFUW4_09251 [Fulvia fulva]WPV35127.1 hypothetical protein CLAFUW7_09252 [Fulvia fulva]